LELLNIAWWDWDEEKVMREVNFLSTLIQIK
jgi:hypothetical protein